MVEFLLGILVLEERRVAKYEPNADDAADDMAFGLALCFRHEEDTFLATT